MVALSKVLFAISLLTGAQAQGQFGASENSAAILAALKTVDQSTIASSNSARAYTPNNRQATRQLTNANIKLRADWQYVIYLAQSSLGFYSMGGGQDIIEYIQTTLYPDTRDADKIYTDKRDTFVAGGFISFINPGLLQLRTAVDAASAAVQAKTLAAQLTNMTEAFTLIEQDYANTQEIQMFGP